MSFLVSKECRHCDTYIQDVTQPFVLRWYLYFERLPAIEKSFMREVLKELGRPEPTLVAFYEDKPVRVVMASRLGNVGVTYDLERSKGYTGRVHLCQLRNFQTVAEYRSSTNTRKKKPPKRELNNA